MYRETLEHFELPEWYSKYNHIEGGYKKPGLTIWEYIKLLFHWNNETVNTWIHLIGGVAFTIALVWMVSQPKWKALKTSQYWLFIAISLCLGTVMYIFSTISHTIYCKDEQCHAKCWLYDQIGAGASIFGVAAGFVYFAFMNEPEQQYLYVGIIAGLYGLTVHTLLKYEENHNKERRNLVLGILMIILWGLSFIITAHSDIYETNMKFKHITYHMFLSGMLVIIGGMLFFLGIPERFFKPGTFDYIGNSHQLFHLCITIPTFLYLYLSNQYIDLYDALKAVPVAPSLA